MCLIWFFILIKYLYLKNVWFGVTPRMDETKYNVCLQEIGLRVQNVITILGSIVSMIEGDLYDHFMSLRIFISSMNR